MINQVPERVDVVVCGAGPAGLVAAWRMAQAGLSVALLDRRDPWREPVSCAEAVHAEGLRKWVDEIDPAWVRGPVDGVVFVAPDETRIEYTQYRSGLILDRALMHKGLAERAFAAGAKIHFRANILRLERSGEEWLVHCTLESVQDYTISCRAVIDASGPGGKLTKGIAGLEALEDGAFDLEPAVFTILEGIDYPSTLIELGFSQRRFPGGYGWVFPRDAHSANVGLVIGKEHLAKSSPRKLLQQWLAERWPNVKVGTFYGGAIACGQSNKPLAALGLFKVGDAASMVNPISRSGIVEGMKGGALAAKSVHAWLNAPSPEQRKAIEANLFADWMELQGENHARLHRAKSAFGSIPDPVFDRAAHRILSIPVAKRSLFRIFLSTLLGSPMLLWRMRSLMGF